MSVPVAGTVQVYSSNGSAHYFTTSVTVTKANEFQRFAVTVSPKVHTGSTTESTIEFYGTYGSGRIPTIQNYRSKQAIRLPHGAQAHVILKAL